MTTWVSMSHQTLFVFFFFTSVNICPITMFFGKYMTLFLCVINEIIMKIKLNKILFLNLFFVRSGL
jgi:hypothetical protein